MADDGFPVSQHPRLAHLADTAQAAWLWSGDGSRILWCNEAAAIALGLADWHEIEKPRSPADPHRRQVSQLARRLKRDGATRLERLRGFGARFGGLMTCACSRIALLDDEAAILIVATESTSRTAASIVAGASAVNEPGESHDPAPPVGETTPAEQPPVAPPAAGTTSDAAPTDAVADIDTAPTAAAVAGREQPDPAATPLRFVWQIDAEGRFALHASEFLRMAGDPTALVQGLAWSEVALSLGLDPLGRMADAMARRETFSNIGVGWPLEGSSTRAAVELSGMPIFERLPTFAGYRGFGIYRPGVAPADEPPRSIGAAAEAPAAAPPPDVPLAEPQADPAPVAVETPTAPEALFHTETETVEPPQNVVPFPLPNDVRPPTLSVHENHAFDEIARRLTGRLEVREPVNERADSVEPGKPENVDTQSATHATTATDQPAWLTAAAMPARGEAGRDRMLLDLVPSGILIYRLDRLLYANPAFLDRTGFANLHTLQEAGGLDALYVEPGASSSSSASDAGMPLKIAPSDRSPADARLFSIDWNGEAAHALILQPPTAAQSRPAEAPPPQQAIATAADDSVETVLEAASDGFVLFDRSGEIVTANRSAQALFGFSRDELTALNFADLFAPDSQRTVLDCFESLDTGGATRPVQGREVLGRVRAGGFASLSMTMGRAGRSGERFFALFKDLSQQKRSEPSLVSARRMAERASTAKADALAAISQEIRSPLNTIVGFANLMIEQRFGLLGNERYADYLKDIRGSAERALATLDDVVNISSIEAGKLDLKLAGQNLNEMVEQCVSVLQPQANRERVIIRTSLAHTLPQVMADTHALRQITMNIVTSSIRSSKAGGQVIVSTAASENGGAVLRVRDTGRALSEAELAAAMGTSGVAGADHAAVDLSLARALAEANRAHFQIKTTENAGTLIEVAFANVRALAG